MGGFETWSFMHRNVDITTSLLVLLVRRSSIGLMSENFNEAMHLFTRETNSGWSVTEAVQNIFILTRVRLNKSNTRSGSRNSRSRIGMGDCIRSLMAQDQSLAYYLSKIIQSCETALSRNQGIIIITVVALISGFPHKNYTHASASSCRFTPSVDYSLLLHAVCVSTSLTKIMCAKRGTLSTRPIILRFHPSQQ